MKKKTTITTETRQVCVIAGVVERELTLSRNEFDDVASSGKDIDLPSEDLVTHKPQAKGLHKLLRILRATYQQ